MRHAVVALGITQIIGYGSLYYAFPIAAPAIAAELGVPQTQLYAAFSAGLVAGGLMAPWAGRTMDRIGPARLMTAGSLAATLVLAALAALPLGFWGTALAVVALEVIAICVTYDAAFATLVALRGPGGRRAISNLTLIAGFASTVFWPLTGWMVDVWGWRATYGAFAALHLLGAMPLHWMLSRSPPAGPPAPGAPAAQATAATFAPLSPAQARRGLWLVGISFTLTGVAIAALTVHLVPLLVALDIGASPYGVAMVLGPSQVAIRLLEATAWRHRHPVFAALISACCLPGAALVLLIAPGTPAALTFAAILGAGAGLTSIVRGSLPLALFGPLGFGARLGRLAAPRQIAAALAPLAMALLLARSGPQAALAAAAAFGLAGVIPMVALRMLIAADRP